MTKNQFGGNKQKSQARKFIQQKDKSNTLRFSENNCEHYAIVKKLLGNGRCLVHTHENKEKNCIIRGKFRGRKKRDNTLKVGSWVLVDTRDWQSSESQDCDLLEVYTDIEKDKLKSSQLPINWGILDANNYHVDALLKENNTTDVYFMNENEEEYENIINKSMENNENKITKEEYEYNIDDI
uniref:S1-like domain-containing protein n=1 Tax=viral metagenome TaxID=1070528 RepID=A0A6C0H6B4_9ZZZZ